MSLADIQSMKALKLAKSKEDKKGKFDDLQFPMSKTPLQNTMNSAEKFYFEPLFYLNGTDNVINMQTLTYHDGYVYVGYSNSDGVTGLIRKYDVGGKQIKDSGSLNTGHTAGLAYRNSNSHVYVANGGDVQPAIYEINMEATTPSILSTLNLNLGQNAIISIDNVNDHLILHTAPTITSGSVYGSHTFYTLAFDGTVISQFTIPNQGVPQGITYYQNQIYLYVNNYIIVLDMTGKILQTIPISKTGESQGVCIAADYAEPYIIIGFNTPNRLYALRSTGNQAQYHSFHPYNSVNRQDTGATALLPTIATVAINNNAGANAWAVASWGNGYNWTQIVKSITSTTGATGSISVKFVHPIKSVGIFMCDVNFKMASLGYFARCNFTDPDTLVIQVYNASGTQIDPSAIPTLCTIKCLIIGAIHISD